MILAPGSRAGAQVIEKAVKGRSLWDDAVRRLFRNWAAVSGMAVLAVLVLVAMPMKYINHDDTVVVFTGIPHGWLYMILLITAYDLGRRVGWSIKWFIAIMLAGTVPFLSFVAEHFATKNVRATLARSEEAAA